MDFFKKTEKCKTRLNEMIKECKLPACHVIKFVSSFSSKAWTSQDFFNVNTETETKTNTVKPELTATSEQRPTANNGQPKPGQIKFNSNFDRKTSLQRPPVYYGQYFGVPRVAVVDRFDCILTF
jgi:hypothetical protein